MVSAESTPVHSTTRASLPGLTMTSVGGGGGVRSMLTGCWARVVTPVPLFWSTQIVWLKPSCGAVQSGVAVKGIGVPASFTDPPRPVYVLNRRASTGIVWRPASTNAVIVELKILKQRDPVRVGSVHWFPIQTSMLPV